MPQTRKDFPYDRKLPVAARAKAGKPNRKQAKVLAARIADWTATQSSRPGGKKELRIGSGGFHKPGSNQR